MGIGFKVPFTLVGGATEDAVVRTGNDVSVALGVVFVEHETLQTGVADPDDLAPYRLHGHVTHEVAGAQADAVHDHARVTGHLLERGEGALLHCSSGGGEAAHEIREVEGHLDYRRDKSVAVQIARWQFVFVAASDVGDGFGPPGVGNFLVPDLHAFAHQDAALREGEKLFEDLVSPASPGEDAVFGVGLVRVPDRGGHAGGRGLRELGRHDPGVEPRLPQHDGGRQPDHAASHDYSISTHHGSLLVVLTICPGGLIRDLSERQACRMYAMTEG